MSIFKRFRVLKMDYENVDESLKETTKWGLVGETEAQAFTRTLGNAKLTLALLLELTNTLAISSIGTAIHRNHEESEERHREMITLQINNMRKTDLENDPQFTAYLESIAADLNSSIAHHEPQDPDDDTTANTVFQAEIDRDKLLVDLRQTTQEKMESDRELASALQEKTKIDEELKQTINASERSRKRGTLIW